MAKKFAALRFTRMLSTVVSRKRFSITKDDNFVTAADKEPWKTVPNLDEMNKRLSGSKPNRMLCCVSQLQACEYQNLMVYLVACC